MDIETDKKGGTAELLRQPEDGHSTRAAVAESDRPGIAEEHDSVPLLTDERSARFRERWEACQRDFVDEPKKSVEVADQLVADLIRELAAQFAEERSRLEEQWSRGGEVSTDELRYALQRYRSFFNRLLEV